MSSRDLAVICLGLHADEGAAGRLRQHLRLRKRPPSAYNPTLFQPVWWIHWKRSEKKPWSDLAVNMYFGRDPKILHQNMFGRTIGL